jgi:hypothetical protein
MELGTIQVILPFNISFNGGANGTSSMETSGFTHWEEGAAES